MLEIVDMVKEERKRQNELWGFPQSNSPMEWGSILGEEFGELCQALNDYQSMVKWSSMHDVKELEAAANDALVEAIQVAAVAVNISEHLAHAIEMMREEQNG